MAAEMLDRDEETDTGRRGMDPEVLVISRMLRMLEELDDGARGRVVRYLSARYPQA